MKKSDDWPDQPILLDFCCEDVFDIKTVVPLQVFHFPFHLNFMQQR